MKNPPAMQEAGARSLDWEDTPEKGMATHSSIFVWRVPWTKEPGHGFTKSQTRLNKHFHSKIFSYFPLELSVSR